MRYVIALVAAGLVIGCLSLVANQSASALQKRMRQKLIAAQAAGETPAEVDLNSGDFTDFGMEVSASERFQIGLLDCWYAYRIILIPALVGIALIVAHYWVDRNQTPTLDS